MPRQKWLNASGTSTYFVWRNMRRRCTNVKDDSYSDYGGRGITVCPEWLESYDKFVEDMGFKPDNMTLERIDTNKGYSPDNCIWASMRDNLNNRRNTIKIKDTPVTVLAEQLGIKPDTLRKRMRYGVDESRLFLPKANAPRQAEHGTRLRYERDGCICAVCRAHNAERAYQFRLKKKKQEAKE